MRRKKGIIILGITGTLGAGKGTIVDYLIHKKGFLHFSVREHLITEIVRRGLPVNRDSMVVVANELRANNNPAYIIEQLYHQASVTGKDCIIESIRTPGEVASLRSKEGFFLLAVDADARIRYERIKLRQSETDAIDYATFIENEQREMHSDDPNKQNLSACIDMADYTLTNNGSIEDLRQQIDEFIRPYIKQL